MAGNAGEKNSFARHFKFPTITPRKSDRGVKSGAEMMDILVDDIMRYESLAEMDEMMVLDALIHGDKVENTDNVVELVELEVMPITEVPVSDAQGVVATEEEEILPQVSNTRYKSVTLEDTDTFLQNNKNKNTTYKTNSDLKMFYDWCRSNGNLRLVEDVPAEELDVLLSRFYIGVRRKDGEEYEPGTLTGVQNSIDRHLKDNKSMIDIKKDKLFDHSRKILETKRKELKGQGKGNKKNRAEAVEPEDVKLLYNKQILGAERTTKTRTGAKAGDERPVAPKMFAQEDNDNCPVRLLKLYLSKRPSDLKNDPNSRFYLRPLVNVNVDTEVWYSHQPLGKNKLGEMMKMMANQAQLSGRKVNHSTRKTFASSLLQSERPITEVAQLGGWKSVSTLTHYNTPSIKQQIMASNIIAQTAIPDLNEDTNSINEHSSNIENADVTCNTAVRDENFNINDDITVERYCTPSQLHSVNSNTLAVKNRQETNPFNILCGASVTGGTVNINIFSGKRKFESSQE
ncbi:Hypothetical predicted protein [Mytilus galloprovincialis]|uniref:DUF3504 domain-containing protein n=1 Tax=Mytilus galloprovincialis TaxID=29158 RepID=A0A8B6FGA2_MYTGA|nr:Hypothetical predicted protein [Mytilus galloprovincialis]